MDLYQTNLRTPSSQLNVTPIPNCQTKRNPTPCPLSYPVNAGNGIYRGVEVHADQQLGQDLHVLAGWDVDSSFLTVIPASIQDGTLVAGRADSRPAAAQGVRRDRSRAADGPRLRRAPRLRGRV